MLTYQQEMVASTAVYRVLVVEKSRRIGASWAAAEAAVETAALARSAGGMDVLYIGYNLEMAREFIDDAAFWAGHLSGFAKAIGRVEEYVFEDDNERAIKAFRISFDSGFAIIALSSRPRSLRGRQGFVIIDEAAFHDDLAGLLKAALALLMWGGRVWVLSTHFGADNPFNEMVEEVRSGKKPYGLMRVTFDDAIEQGLYKRIALMTGEPWTQEGEDAWVAQIRDFYGDDAAEELDCIPAAGEGVWLSRALIKACMTPRHRVVAHTFEDGFEQKTKIERESYVEAWLADFVDPILDELSPDLQSFLGGDVGRSGDLSTFAVGQLETSRLIVPLLIELRNCPFAQQEQILHHVIGRLPRFQKGALDARGIGAQLSEQAAQKFGFNRIAQVMATVEWYRENMPPLKARFEDGTILIPLDDDVTNDLRLVKLVRGVAQIPSNARTTRSSRGGQRHGDAAIALANLEYASQLDPVEYGYEAAPRSRGHIDEGSATPGRARMRPNHDSDYARVGSRGTW